MKKAGKLPEESLKMFNPKPIEELYDLQNDPAELTNLIHVAEHGEIAGTMRKKVREHIITTRETGFMAEGEMMIMAENRSVYELA